MKERIVAILGGVEFAGCSRLRQYAGQSAGQ